MAIAYLTSVSEFFHAHRKRLDDTGVKVLFVESIVPYYENLMRQWCFVCGLFGLFVASVGIRIAIRRRRAFICLVALRRIEIVSDSAVR